MTQFETEMQDVKSELINMWDLVLLQLSKAKESMLNFDKDLAREVVLKEKRVNALEIKIDRDCENIFALYCPVAIDLRFLLAVLKINNNLERIGDIAEGIAKYIVDSPVKYNMEILEAAGVIKMFEDSISIFTDTRVAFEFENTLLARTIFSRDDILDEINKKADDNILKFIIKDPGVIKQSLYILSIIRKLERVGDQSKNIAEEIIFYVEAKVLKHQ
ncbi:phosphate signaling complex protein PhoU [Ginsengibacter hankyongi]|uniref:Phosphate-specific transport system accessory protein PhoU n=1 Tax=Ginsengibacter hankyongi TaxID=2607284 RepID=A0A5J5ILD6_9BACT|nr:phosphate signaling complex protein PhoU [Ginsengibacter hankyongi]KAA9039467.1 phosphate signaling complex protein PhoU [Ginsengibacter hankyongi]